MDRRKFEKIIKLLFVLSWIIVIIAACLIYFLSFNVLYTVISSVGMMILCGIIFCIHHLDNLFITGIISDLSKLTDILTELEEKQIFSENEDTIVSKLQSKIIKLVKILKKRNETSLQEHENIKALVSDISHQLKTPIANLIMYSEFLEDSTLSEKKRMEYTGIIRLSVGRLNFLSESMIKISRLESGLIHLNMQEQSLNETVLKAVKDVYVKARNKGTEIIYREEKNISIFHDRNWTSEGIFNLLDNAVKYSERGSKIYLTVKSFGMFASVEVADENTPIPEEERNKIFSRFYRGNNSKNIEGIGIGLYLSREIAVRQGGYMNLKASDKGNVFSFVLYSKPSKM